MFKTKRCIFSGETVPNLSWASNFLTLLIFEVSISVAMTNFTFLIVSSDDSDPSGLDFLWNTLFNNIG